MTLLHMRVAICQAALLTVLLPFWHPSYAEPRCAETFWDALSLISTQPDKAIGLLTEAANRNDQCAVQRLYIAYEFGDGASADPKLAMYWLKRGAEIGVANMQYIFGRRLIDGNDVEKDFEEGMKWIRLSANQGYEDANWYLNQLSKPNDLKPK